jgi:glycosyltransferase involved in cell wall biosynthesis
MTKLSVALTSYNSEKTIVKVIKNILDQSFSNFDLNIFDDNSSDNTFEIISELSKFDERIKIFKNNIRLGDFKNWNKALKQCLKDDARYFTWQSDHDFLDQNFFKNSINLMSINNLSFVYGKTKYIEDIHNFKCVKQDNSKVYSNIEFDNFTNIDNFFEKPSIVGDVIYGIFDKKILTSSIFPSIIFPDRLFIIDLLLKFNKMVNCSSAIRYRSVSKNIPETKLAAKEQFIRNQLLATDNPYSKYATYFFHKYGLTNQNKLQNYVSYRHFLKSINLFKTEIRREVNDNKIINNLIRAHLSFNRKNLEYFILSEIKNNIHLDVIFKNL